MAMHRVYRTVAFAMLVGCFFWGPLYGAEKIDFWDTAVRRAYDKWAGQGRDFLIGDADNYQGLV
ncbi:MAG: hypothetical protein LBD74_08480 [Spirochaetaceae bacterium]|jgi:hypothetical protein|nr:hypothetical protein [Spirochaetaceae bacterium]